MNYKVSLFSINTHIIFFLKLITDKINKIATAFIHTFHISFYSNKIIDIYCILKSKTPYYTKLTKIALDFHNKVT